MIFDPDVMTAWQTGHPCEVRGEVAPLDLETVDVAILKRFAPQMLEVT